MKGIIVNLNDIDIAEINMITAENKYKQISESKKIALKYLRECQSEYVYIKNRVLVNGIVFKNKSAAIKHYKVDAKSVTKKQNNGMSIEDAINTTIKNRRCAYESISVVVFGVEYSSIALALKSNRVDTGGRYKKVSNERDCSIGSAIEYMVEIAAYMENASRNKVFINPVSTLYQLECEMCGGKFVSRYKRKHCNRECELEAQRIRSREIYYSKDGVNQWKECRECGDTFEVSTHYRNHCSDKCIAISKKRNRKKHRTGTHRKRAMKYGVKYDSTVTLSAVKNRDGRRCLLCGRKTLKNNRSGYYHKNAAIGHIVAMCNGGDHLMNNVQLECAECNVNKGSMDYGQLRLEI